MILVCPRCNARYLIPAEAFADGPRQVRCARCAHNWEADTPAEVTVVKPPEPPPPAAPTAEAVINNPEQPEVAAAPIAEIAPVTVFANLPALRHNLLAKYGPAIKVAVGMLALLILVAVLGILGCRLWQRHSAAELLTGANGLTVYHVTDGMSLQNIHSEKHYEDGAMRLGIDGIIRNDSASSQPVPDLQASALGPDGKVMISWKITVPATTLEAGGTLPFQSSVTTPQGTVVEVNLSFIERQNGTE